MNAHVSRHLPLPHFLLALAIMAVWGTNFVVIKLALAHLTPLTLATARFFFVFFPMALVLPRPAVAWSNLAAYGVLIGAGQFGLLFTAMHIGLTPGLASLVLQLQVFFTIALAAWWWSEKIAAYQIAALALAACGLALVAQHTSAATVTPLALGLAILAAFCWGCGNLVSRSAGRVNMLAYVVWSGIFAVPPLAVLALAIDGWGPIRAGIASATLGTWVAVGWQSVGNTMFGYAMWGWLLARHPSSTVAPMALMVPVFGMSASALYLGEPLQAWKLGAFALVMGGLAIGIAWPSFRNRILR
jgi:O-acetylserine/cysteine efflux transporter